MVNWVWKRVFYHMLWFSRFLRPRVFYHLGWFSLVLIGVGVCGGSDGEYPQVGGWVFVPGEDEFSIVLNMARCVSESDNATVLAEDSDTYKGGDG